MQALLYIGPGLGAGTIILTLIVVGLVLFALGYLVWFRLKRLFKKKDKTE